ncbi:Spc98 family-domain-containing protein [Chaetomidium leptoderma]|uniref:Spc98 family-domain-containing protein n=1 Tax=Chaetomidium leptoderma TaxID=669021 RepID=A0AAN6ZZ15_9PEZI|nr:Spc98 family-domain-containing protein [Chaetomidium leptoderma]
MPSGHNDPKLLYAINGVSAYHIANGKEELLTPAGPQTLSLLMIYHQPPTSYLIPRWDLGPDSGAFTRIEFPSVESRKGIQEDVDTFETILAQCTAFLERAPPPRMGKTGRSLEGKGEKSAAAKAAEAAGDALPAYNPADFKPGEGYARGSHSGATPGQIVLVDEEDGSVIGELTDAYQIVEASGLKPGSKDPVEITLSSDGGQKINVAPISAEMYEAELHPAYQKSFLVSNASAASRFIITGSDMISRLLQNQADSFTKKTQPSAKPMTFKPATRDHIRRISTFTGGAATLSAKTVGQITKVAHNFGATFGGHGKGKDKDGSTRKGYDKDGKPVSTYKPGLLNKSMMAFSTVMDGVEQAGRNLLTSTSDVATTVVTHKWGDEAGDVTRSVGGGVKNVGLVYIDVTGVSRRAILKSVAKGMVVGHTVTGDNIIVGGGDGGAADLGQGAKQDAQSLSGMTVVEGKQPAGALNGKPTTPNINTQTTPTRSPTTTTTMLHEILLSLSGHPSPLLRSASAPSSTTTIADNSSSTTISPPERALLSSLARLSDLHIHLLTATAHIAATHPSVICRAVASAIDARHLAAFRQKVLRVEETILRQDAGLVGAYHIVPLTAVVGEFDGWGRRLEWLALVVEVVVGGRSSSSFEKNRGGGGGSSCTGARVMDFLRGELQTGYRDVEEMTGSLVAVAEAAWVKQVSAWVLYGRLPGFGEGDFFVRKGRVGEDGDGDGGEGDYRCEMGLLPGFVTPATAASMLFIGRSLNQIRAKSVGDYSLRGNDHLSTQLTRLAALKHPIDSATFARTIADIRQFLSRTTLQRLLPLSRVIETLQLLRDFFLLRRGEFAMALTQQADEKIRSRWKRAENLAYEKRDGFSNVTVKEGEVAAVLARTWAAMGSMQGEHAEEDEGLELGRDLLRLAMTKSRAATPMTPASAEGGLAAIAPTPFRNLLFSVPVVLTLQIPSPLDLFLSQSDLQTYTAINSYLLSLRRAHLRLTDLWKITSLRRHHPAPPGPPYGSTRGGREQVHLFRQRHAARSSILRNAWATASAAIFFLGETEGYLQTEVVAGLSDGFHRWLTTGEDEQRHDDDTSKQPPSTTPRPRDGHDTPAADDDDDIWLAESTSSSTPAPSESQDQTHPHHDPQTLATAHRLYLGALVHRLLLSQQSFTDPLYELLVQIDHLVALVHRLHSVWAAADLEADAGVVDAFVDLEREERDVQGEIRGVEGRVKRDIEGLIGELRLLEGRVVGVEDEGEMVWMRETGEYVPRRVGGIDRLLMKLDFGSWFRREGGDGGGGGDGDEMDLDDGVF